MTVDVVTETTIKRPVGLVAKYAADPSNAPYWCTNIEHIEWKTPPPLQVGSLVEFVGNFLGRRLRCTYEIVEFKPRERLVMRTAEGPFPMETSYAWAATGKGETTMTLHTRREQSGFGKLTAPVIKLVMRQANKDDLRRLKSILERHSGPRPRGGRFGRAY